MAFRQEWDWSNNESVEYCDAGFDDDMQEFRGGSLGCRHRKETVKKSYIETLIARGISAINSRTCGQAIKQGEFEVYEETYDDD